MYREEEEFEEEDDDDKEEFKEEEEVEEDEVAKEQAKLEAVEATSLSEGFGNKTSSRTKTMSPRTAPPAPRIEELGGKEEGSGAEAWDRRPKRSDPRGRFAPEDDVEPERWW